MNKNECLGCQKKIKVFNNKEVEDNLKFDFICGVPDAWGYERLCFKCRKKLNNK